MLLTLDADSALEEEDEELLVGFVVVAGFADVTGLRGFGSKSSYVRVDLHVIPPDRRASISAVSALVIK